MVTTVGGEIYYKLGCPAVRYEAADLRQTASGTVWIIKHEGVEVDRVTMRLEGVPDG